MPLKTDRSDVIVKNIVTTSRRLTAKLNKTNFKLKLVRARKIKRILFTKIILKGSTADILDFNTDFFTGHREHIKKLTIDDDELGSFALFFKVLCTPPHTRISLEVYKILRAYPLFFPRKP